MHRTTTQGLLVLAVTLVAQMASAHVAPSKDDNNRYLKLTPQRDRVRLAYTVFFGEVPGAAARREIDENHDGTISEAEAQHYGDKLAAEVAANLDVAVDKIQAKIGWADVTVGMGSPAVHAGAFSIDMITQFCTTGGSHELILRDRFRLLHPGETEVRIETPTGIDIHKERVGASTDPAHLYKFVGPGGPLADDGIELAYEITDKAAPADGTCTAPGDEDNKRGLPPTLVVGGSALVAFSLAVLVTLVRRRKK
jgi:hypothetical protein